MSYKNALSMSTLSTSEVTQTDTKMVSRRKSSPRIMSTSIINQQENDQIAVSDSKTSDETGQCGMMDVTKSKNSDLSKEFGKEDENVLNEKIEERITQVAEDALRKLHRDVIEALTKQQASSKIAKEASVNSPGSKTDLEVQDDAVTTTKITVKAEGEKRSSIKHQKVDIKAILYFYRS